MSLRRVLKIKLLDKYISREFLVSYLIVLTVILSLRVIIDLFVKLDEFVEKSPSGQAPTIIMIITNIASYYGPKLFEYFRDFSGLVILAGAAFSLARLSRQNELTAIMASGISLKRVVAPIIIIAFLFNLLAVADQELVLPGLADKLARNPDEAARMGVVRDIFLPDRDNALFWAGRYDPETRIVENLVIIKRKNRQLTGHITAEKASWLPNRKCWVLVNGVYHNDNYTNYNASANGTGTKSLQNQASYKVLYYKSDLDPDYLWLQRNSAYKNLMSTTELTDLLKRNLKKAEYRDIIAQKHFRVADVIINMVMLLLSLPMLISREKRVSGSALLLGVVGAGSCFLITFVCKFLAGTVLDPLIAAGLPVIIFLPLSVVSFDSIKT